MDLLPPLHFQPDAAAHGYVLKEPRFGPLSMQGQQGNAPPQSALMPSTAWGVQTEEQGPAVLPKLLESYGQAQEAPSTCMLVWVVLPALPRSYAREHYKPPAGAQP